MASSYPLFFDRPDGTTKVLSVSQLSQLIERTLESAFHSLWVSGEVTEVSRPHSGHIYFTLRDEAAQMRAVIWRSVASRLRFDLEDGQQVICHGDIDVYPPRGTYQLVIRQLEPKGQGALQLAFRQLQRRLEEDGLFDPLHKRRLPLFPRRVGFVTSPTGAAIRDFLEVARRRFSGVEIIVIPARVQGEGSADEIARGIWLANRLRPKLDVLVVGRGGGSLEDLWSFNEEIVVRAIYGSEVPVVSAVGHEIDVTLADLVADVRALTPSEAAERVIPSAEELTSRLEHLRRRLATMLRARAENARQRLAHLARSRVLRQPQQIVYDRSRRLDELEASARRAILQRLSFARQQLAAHASRLEALSPLSVLSRGYSVSTDAASGAVLTSAVAVQAGQRVRTQLASGSFTSLVEASCSGEPIARGLLRDS